MITRRLIGAGLLLVWVPVAEGQAGHQSPNLVNSFAVDAGHAFRFAAGQNNEGWYRVVYQGRPVREHGTPFQFARSLDLLAPKLEEAGGDVPQLGFRYENLQATADGGLLEALGARELPLAGLSALRLRGVARLGSDARLKHITAAVGLETPPLRLPGLAGSGVTNWVVAGVNAERRESSDDEVTSANHALGTFRAFAGKAFGWRKSADVGSTAGKIVQDILALAPTRTAALALRATIDSIPAARRTSLQQTVLDAIPEATSDEDWERTVRALAFGEADAITDQPTLAILLEGSGWIQLAGEDEAIDKERRALVTATIDYWFWPGRDDVRLRLRYEHGYERTQPAVKKDHLLVGFGVRF